MVMVMVMVMVLVLVLVLVMVSVLVLVAVDGDFAWRVRGWEGERIFSAESSIYSSVSRFVFRCWFEGEVG